MPRSAKLRRKREPENNIENEHPLSLRAKREIGIGARARNSMSKHAATQEGYAETYRQQTNTARNGEAIRCEQEKPCESAIMSARE